MFTTFDKAIAAFLSSLLFLVGMWYAPALQLQGVVEPVAAVLVALVTFLVPNKPAAPPAA
jgi:hypothetical protein